MTTVIGGAPERPGYDDADYAAFQQRVKARTGIQLADYKSDQMRRRLSALAGKSGYGSFQAYMHAIESDGALLESFMDTVTINVTELLRNPERFDELTAKVLPDLLRGKQGAALSVWSAGCSYGAEAYTLAMLLNETTPVAPKHRIRGTDIDPLALSKASRPSFSAKDMANISPERRKRHFQDLPPSGFSPNPALKQMVSFNRHDLLKDKYPASEYDLIVCRNVLIYFTDEARARVYKGFFDALKPAGVLFVGGTERISGYAAMGYELLLPFFYKKPEPIRRFAPPSL